MSDDVIIRVENVSKMYALGRRGRAADYTTLRDAVTDAVKAPLRRWRKNGSAIASEKTPNGEFWALRDVNLDVRKGEVIGIIGRNGAGKSTLLKILSRITEPTSGRLSLKGRVASLLEVGTGFHPELTGRENIFLNGAILGMKRTEIKAKFDEIVAFAEVEKFLDTPVKKYSSGMYVRLAFAVAAHLEPEILIVDEVLAVGDAEFQKKCLGKMGEVSEKQGRSVLFVSHNMTAVSKLCARSLVLDGGRVIFNGEVGQAVRKYLKAEEVQSSVIDLRHGVSRSPEVKIRAGRLLRMDLEAHEFMFGDTLTVQLEIEVVQPCRFSVEFLLRDGEGLPIVFLPSGIVEHGQKQCEPGRFEAVCSIPKLNLAQGRYALDVMLAKAGLHVYQSVESAFSFQVVDAQIFHNGWEFRQEGGQGAVLWPPEVSLRPLQREMVAVAQP